MIIEKAIEMSKLIEQSEILKQYTDAKNALAENSELKEDLDYYLNLVDNLDSAEMAFEDLEADQRKEIEELEMLFSEN